MKIFITALAIISSISTVTANSSPEFPPQSMIYPTQSSASVPEPSQNSGPPPGDASGLGRGPTGKCWFGRNYCGWSIKDLHSYADLKEVYCNSPLCPSEQCGPGKTCNPSNLDLDQSVYQCDDEVTGGEGTSVFFLGGCANANWVCVNPEPHCTTPKRVRSVVNGLHYG